MSNLKSLRLAAVAAATLCSTLAFADSANMTVNAVVPGICKVQSLPTMSFALDPSTSADGAQSVTVSYKCTKNVTGGTFSVGGISNGTTGYAGSLAGTTVGNTDAIAYTINWTTPTAFTGDGLGATASGKSVILNGAIPFANYADVAADTYTGTVAIAITP